MSEQPQIKIIAQGRNDTGKSASRRIRRLQERVPAVVYGGKNKPQSLSINKFDLDKLLHIEAIYTSVISLSIDGKDEPVLLKAIDRHPASSIPLHLDFQRVTDDSIVSTHVPIHYLNEDVCVGVKTGGGIITHTLNDVELRGNVNDIPPHIELDVGPIDVGTSVRLSDLELPPNVSIPILQKGQDQVVLSVLVPRGGISSELDEEQTDQQEGEEEETTDE